MLIFNEFLRNARAIQYLTQGEYEASGDKWNKNHIIIPNGCEIPPVKILLDEAMLSGRLLVENQFIIRDWTADTCL